MTLASDMWSHANGAMHGMGATRGTRFTMPHSQAYGFAEHTDPYITMEAVASRGLLVASTSKTLCLYEVPHQLSPEQKPAHHGPAQRMKLVQEWHSEVPVIQLLWDHTGQVLFGAEKCGTVKGYGMCDTDWRVVEPVWQMHLHDDAVTKLLMLPDPNPRRLLTAGLDAGIRMVDVTHKKVVVDFGAGNPKWKRHNKGVFSMAYSQEYSLLISAGFEYDPIIWMPVQGLGNQYIATLRDNKSPHAERLMGVEVIPGTPQVALHSVIFPLHSAALLVPSGTVAPAS